MRTTSILCLVLGLLTGMAYADSLQANATAAMEGSYGLEVLHNNTSPAAYVQDNLPNSEKLYRGEFLFNPNNISPEVSGGNFRQAIFQAIGTNPRPGEGDCPTGPVFTDTFRIWFYAVGGNGQVYTLQAWGRGDLCGDRATLPRITIAKDQPVKVCFEWESGPNPDGGRIALTTVSPSNPCPTSGDSSWVERALSNSLLNVQMVRMGTPQLNAFGVGENGSMYFDGFYSYSTLTP